MLGFRMVMLWLGRALQSSSILTRNYQKLFFLFALIFLQVPATTEIYHSIASILFNGAEQQFSGALSSGRNYFLLWKAFRSPFLSLQQNLGYCTTCISSCTILRFLFSCACNLLFFVPPTHSSEFLDRFVLVQLFVYCLVVQSSRTLVQCSPVSADLAWSGHLQLCNLCRFPWLNFRPYYWG